jgi:hypothetical protein
VVWFGILGPLTVLDDAAVVAVTAAKQRVLLAALLLRANHVASEESGRRAARHRLLDHYLHSGFAAAMWLDPEANAA